MPTFDNDMFREEIAYFDDQRDRWVKEGRQGRYVVIEKSRKVGDFTQTIEQAMKVAYDNDLDPGSFMIEVVLPTGSEEWVSHISPAEVA